MSIAPVSSRIYAAQPYAAAPITPVEGVQGAANVAPGRRWADVYESSGSRETLPRVTYGGPRTAYS